MRATLADQLQWAVEQLSPTSDTAKLDAEVLLAHVLQKSRTFLIAFPERPLTDSQQSQFRELVEQRKQGQPVAYLLGEKEFWSLTLNVTPATLIPRPDTELIVEWVLAHYPDRNDFLALDLGTGSGALALALASERRSWRWLATDISEQALAVARQNAKTNRIDNVDFQQSHWFEQLLPKSFDLIVSNPPYIAAQDPHLTQSDIRFEPPQALVSGQDGLDAIRVILRDAPNYLKPNAPLIVEHGYDQGPSIQALFQHAGFEQIETLNDLAVMPRATLGYRAEPESFEQQ